jgi:hypothetical protein
MLPWKAGHFIVGPCIFDLEIFKQMNMKNFFFLKWFLTVWSTLRTRQAASVAEMIAFWKKFFLI